MLHFYGKYPAAAVRLDTYYVANCLGLQPPLAARRSGKSFWLNCIIRINKPGLGSAVLELGRPGDWQPPPEPLTAIIPMGATAWDPPRPAGG